MLNSVSSCFTAVQQLIRSLLWRQPQEANVRKLYEDDVSDDGKVIPEVQWGEGIINAGFHRESSSVKCFVYV